MANISYSERVASSAGHRSEIRVIQVEVYQSKLLWKFRADGSLTAHHDEWSYNKRLGYTVKEYDYDLQLWNESSMQSR
jgi:hypothetical protein